jgi:hypothetical protein
MLLYRLWFYFIKCSPTISSLLSKLVLKSLLLSGSHLETMTRFFVFCMTIEGFLKWSGHSDERMGSLFYSYNWFWALSKHSLSRSSPAELTSIFCCLTWDFPNLEGQVPVFISPRNKMAEIYSPGTGFLFCSLLRLVGLRWRYSNPHPLWNPEFWSQSQSQSCYDWRSVSMSWCLAPSGSHGHKFVTVRRLLSCFCEATSLARGLACHLSVSVCST